MSANTAAEFVAKGSPGGLPEAAGLSWREPATPWTLRRDERRWTLWTVGILVTFGAPAALLLALSPRTFPAALFFAAHAIAVCELQARRGARSVEPRRRGREDSDQGSEEVALGLLGDLLGHPERELMATTGLAMERGGWGVWLIGEQGALLVRPGGRRVDGWCVRVTEGDDLPAGDRIAHLVLALREDEAGFATVANLGFSGAAWRCRRRMEPLRRPALDAARAAARC